MKYKVLYLTLIFGSLVFDGCTSKTESRSDQAIEKSTQVQLVIYGSNSCGHCIDFKANLDSLNISYTFNDVEQNKALADEMLEVVHAANYYDYIEFPVVAVGKQVFINPPLDQVLNAL
jgi:glutaredoxin